MGSLSMLWSCIAASNFAAETLHRSLGHGDVGMDRFEELVVGRFIVGDVQGCYRTLERLIRHLRSAADEVELWLAGDLVNRGPDSLAVLRWALEEEVTCVLGNHDLYFLALVAGVAPSKGHTLGDLLAAHDCADLADWLRHQPLLLQDESEVMVHAGLHPEWTLEQAHALSRRIEQTLQGSGWRDFLTAVFARSADPLVEAVNCLTRIRMVDANDHPEYAFSGAPEDAPDGLRPWYERSRALKAGRTVYFGHWAALGHRRLPHAISLDGGCVWGRELVAVEASSLEVFTEPAAPGDPCA